MGLDTGDDQRVAGSRQRHVQGVEFFALALRLLRRQRSHSASGWLAFTGQKHKFVRPCRLARPVHQHPHGVSVALRCIRIQQQHHLRFQPLGAMDGEQAHRQRVDRRRRQHAAGFKDAHKSVGRGKTPATQLQRHRKQGAQIGRHGLPLTDGGRCRKTRQHVAIRVDGLQRVVRRQLVEPVFPPRQTRGHCSPVLRRQLGGLQQVKPRRIRCPMRQREPHQGVVTKAEQGGLEHARQRQIVLRRHQHVQQGHHVLHFAAIDQIGLFANLSGYVQRAQFVLQGQQSSPFARQHHDVGGLQASARSLRCRTGKLLRNPGGGLARLQRAQGFFRLFTRGAEAVAPFGCGRPIRPIRCIVRIALVARRAGRPRYGRQFAHGPHFGGTGGVSAKTLVTVRLARISHHCVHGGNHLAGVAPGVVTVEQIPPQAIAHKSLCRLEHLRFSAAEPVNALLGVPHDEDAGRRGTSTGITTEPRAQRLPLQRIGVLKLVDQQMLDAGVEALLHPAREHGVTQHHQGGSLDVIHVDPAVLALERRKLLQQHPAEARHTLLVLPGRMLRPSRRHAQHQPLRRAHPLDTDDFFAKLARCSGSGQQSGKCRRQVARRQRHFQLHTLG